jgi:hypothetical protein
MVGLLPSEGWHPPSRLPNGLAFTAVGFVQIKYPETAKNDNGENDVMTYASGDGRLAKLRVGVKS